MVGQKFTINLNKVNEFSSIEHRKSLYFMKNFHALFIIFIVSSCTIIEKTPSRFQGDGSEIASCGDFTLLYSKDGFTIIEISAEKLKEKVSNKDGVLYLWAPWCAPCYLTLKYNFYAKFDTSSSMIIISTNYDITNIIKILKNKVDTAYVLSCKSFGQNENDKINGISNFLIGKKVDYLPQFYHFNNGEINLQVE